MRWRNLCIIILFTIRFKLLTIRKKFMKRFNNRVIFLFSSVILLSVIIRFIWLERVPPSLYTDEANQGYNAYSLLLTGKDEHVVFLPASLRSFGDWKPPLPKYIMIPFIALTYLNEKAVRWPSAALGVGSIILVFCLIRTLFSGYKDKTKIALLSSFYLTISPWHILQSRAAMLVIISLFLLLLGIYFFIRSRIDPRLLVFSTMSFILCIYAYYGMRIIVPLVVFFLFFQYQRAVLGHKKELIISIAIGIILLMPLFWDFLSNPDVIFGRAKTVSIFYDQGTKLRQWELSTQDDPKSGVFVTR